VIPRTPLLKNMILEWFPTKECPHCGVDDFGLWDLFKLTIGDSGSIKCRNCGGSVRLSGWNKLLTLLATALLPVLGLVLVLLSPWVPEWVIIILIIAWVPLPTMLFAKPAAAEILKADIPPFTVDPRNDKSIVISGWTEDELRKALDDFIEDGSSDSPPKVDVQKRLENLYLLTFPEDIRPSEFVAMVNYLNYPIDLSPAGRAITVAGRATLNSDFEGIPQSLIGKKAVLYVPENDEDYDVVYLRAETGTILENSFNRETWRQVKEPRMGDGVKRLSF
jgi:hypothetical protein